MSTTSLSRAGLSLALLRRNGAPAHLIDHLNKCFPALPVVNRFEYSRYAPLSSSGSILNRLWSVWSQPVIMNGVVSSGPNTYAHSPIYNFEKDLKVPLSFKDFSPSAVKRSTLFSTLGSSRFGRPALLEADSTSVLQSFQEFLTTWAHADLPQLRSSRQASEKLFSGGEY